MALRCQDKCKPYHYQKKKKKKKKKDKNYFEQYISPRFLVLFIFNAKFFYTSKGLTGTRIQLQLKSRKITILPD